MFLLQNTHQKRVKLLKVETAAVLNYDLETRSVLARLGICVVLCRRSLSWRTGSWFRSSLVKFLRRSLVNCRMKTAWSPSVASCHSLSTGCHVTHAFSMRRSWRLCKLF